MYLFPNLRQIRAFIPNNLILNKSGKSGYAGAVSNQCENTTQAVMDSSEQNCTYKCKKIMLQIHTKDITHMR